MTVPSLRVNEKYLAGGDAAAANAIKLQIDVFQAAYQNAIDADVARGDGKTTVQAPLNARQDIGFIIHAQD